MAGSEAAERFRALVTGPEAALPLDEANLLIAASASKNSSVDVDAYLRRLDDLAGGVSAPHLDSLRKHLFLELGFAGNEADYYDPANSYLSDVLDRRLGIPISLAVLMMEVGRRLAIPLAGVSMPGHFLVRDKVDPEVFVDCWARGAVLDRRGCEARFHLVQGPGAVFDPAFLEPVGRRSIVVRMLANLETTATMRSDRELLTTVLRLRSMVPDAGDDVARRLASVLAASGRYDEAADALRPVDALGADRLRAKLN